MSKRNKLEKDYRASNMAIEQAVESEIKRIQEETNSLKEEAQKTGIAVEESINKHGETLVKKKS